MDRKSKQISKQVDCKIEIDQFNLTSFRLKKRDQFCEKLKRKKGRKKKQYQLKGQRDFSPGRL